MILSDAEGQWLGWPNQIKSWKVNSRSGVAERPSSPMSWGLVTSL